MAYSAKPGSHGAHRHHRHHRHVVEVPPKTPIPAVTPGVRARRPRRPDVHDAARFHHRPDRRARLGRPHPARDRGLGPACARRLRHRQEDGRADGGGPQAGRGQGRSRPGLPRRLRRRRGDLAGHQGSRRRTRLRAQPDLCRGQAGVGHVVVHQGGRTHRSLHPVRAPYLPQVHQPAPEAAQPVRARPPRDLRAPGYHRTRKEKGVLIDRAHERGGGGRGHLRARPGATSTSGW